MNVDVSLSPEIKSRIPALQLVCVSANIKVEKHHAGLWQEINEEIECLTATMKAEEIGTVAGIAAMRNAYKALGKDPSRYRGSAEALVRRVLSGKGLYPVNNVVDINNLVSLGSLHPAGSYDLERLKAPVQLRIGLPGESYKGIGKDVINIENLPVFSDQDGPFGSPTSDSERAMIRPETSRIFMVIFSFIGMDGLDAAAGRAADLLQKYAEASGLGTFFVS